MDATSNRVAELDAAIAAFDLNKHPFYQDWRMGTLPTEKLKAYAAEYGAFVATIDKGWETLGFEAYAEEEREHDALWQDFRKELNSGYVAVNPATDVLTHAAKTFFASKAEAVGALYAFEAQQPHTSRSKLDGLKEHYSFSDKAQEYFVVHADDIHEAEDLRTVALEMSDADFAKTRTACAVMAAAMWSALDGVYYN
ncbi:MAG: iron-containing redox enzyme family protein [Armatimonadota bacterium]